MPLTRRLKVLIGNESFACLAAEAIKRYPVETGGILLGRRSERSVLITEVVGPGPRARHERTWFEPDQEWQEVAVADAWLRSGGSVEYLGDWHSHPAGRLKPSRLDLTAAQTIASSHEARAQRPLMLIVGVAATGSTTAALFEFRNGRLVRRSLSLDRFLPARYLVIS